MATVGLSPYVVTSILDKVEEVFRNKHTNLPTYPTDAPTGVGDEAFSLILPPENEKSVRELIPDWAFPVEHGMHLGLNSDSHPGNVGRELGYVYAPYKDTHINVHGRGTIRNVSGIDSAVWQSGYLLITPATDGSTIKLPALRDFVANMREVASARDSATEEIKKARGDMATFLRPHRTLQKAVKAFGPSLMEFVPEFIQADFNREPIKRAVRAKIEPVEVDTNYLVAAAVSHKLNLN